MSIRFTDGVEFDAAGDYRVEQRADGWYVIGRGMLCAVESAAEGEEMIRELREGNARTATEKGKQR